jgi:50S ribosomal protein L16 3-hydroxylase
MNLDRPTAWLGGLSPAAFVHRHWQKTPHVIRASGLETSTLDGLDARRLFALAAQDDVESRLVVQTGARWSVRAGPLSRRALPALSRRGWTLLVQGVDLHDERARHLLDHFRFVGDALLDDVMVSFASDGGGVGPHVDSYDVFLLQLAGRRRWRIGRVERPRLRDDMPLKMLAGFAPDAEWLLEAGDMLYLPPGWGHDGVAVGPCLTASIGFRAPRASALAADVLQRLAEGVDAGADEAPPSDADRYRDRAPIATDRPARIPPALQRFAAVAVAHALQERRARERALGEALSEPKPGTWFERREAPAALAAVVLDRRTRVLYDEHHVFINGESYRAGGSDAKLVRRLADRRVLDAARVGRLSEEAARMLAEWRRAGWCIDADGALDEETR